jgi:DNA-binding MarR family transcriptional regulator
MNDERPDGPATREPKSKTVTLSGRDVRSAIRLLRRLVAGELAAMPIERQLEEARVGKTENWSQLTARAHHALVNRRLRRRFFNPDLFSEPAWELLLALYIEHQGRRLNLAQLTEFVGLAPTTVLRWIEYLEEQRLVCRSPQPTDRRGMFVELTDKGRSAMEAYLSETAVPL